MDMYEAGRRSSVPRAGGWCWCGASDPDDSEARNVMESSFGIPALLAVTLGVLLTLRHFAAPEVSLAVRLQLALSWTLSLSILALVPADVAATASGDTSARPTPTARATRPFQPARKHHTQKPRKNGRPEPFYLVPSRQLSPAKKQRTRIGRCPMQ